MNVHVVKPIPIDFKQVADAYGKVKRGGKATGIDKESWSDFARMAVFQDSSRYFPVSLCI